MRRGEATGKGEEKRKSGAVSAGMEGGTEEGQRRDRGGTEEAQRRDRGGTEEGQRRAFSERDVLVVIDVVVVVIAVAVPRLGSAECAERLNNNENNCSYTTHKQSNRQGKYRCAQNLFLHNLFTTGTPGMPIREAAIDGYR